MPGSCQGCQPCELAWEEVPVRMVIIHAGLGLAQPRPLLFRLTLDTRSRADPPGWSLAAASLRVSFLNEVPQPPILACLPASVPGNILSLWSKGGWDRKGEAHFWDFRHLCGHFSPPPHKHSDYCALSMHRCESAHVSPCRPGSHVALCLPSFQNNEEWAERQDKGQGALRTGKIRMEERVLVNSQGTTWLMGTSLAGDPQLLICQSWGTWCARPDLEP